MNVHFEFKDKHDTIETSNNINKEMDNNEILILLQSNEISYPLSMGSSARLGHGTINNIEFDMFREPYSLNITLKEK